jgi:ribosomal protein S18 acetylase RimI-like enzyme
MTTTITIGYARVDIDWDGAQSLPAADRHPHLRDLVVDRDKRRQGYGERVVREAIRLIGRPTTVGIVEGNRSAMMLFWKVGFRPLDIHWDSKRQKSIFILIHPPKK